MGKTERLLNVVLSSDKTPIVLTVTSCLGVVATGIMAAKAAPKANMIIEELREQEGKKNLPPGIVLKKTWKTWAPAVGAGIVTITSIIAMNRVSTRNLALVSTSAAMATNALREYQQNVIEEIGIEKENKVRNRMAKDAVAVTHPNEDDAIFIANDEGDVAMFDSFSGRYFKQNPEDIRAIENDLNKSLLVDMSFSLNEFYERIGLEPVEMGYLVGFNLDNMLDIHFGSALTPKKKPVVVISHRNLPIPDYEKIRPS